MQKLTKQLRTNRLAAIIYTTNLAGTTNIPFTSLIFMPPANIILSSANFLQVMDSPILSLSLCPAPQANPPMLIELKWDENAHGAITQIEIPKSSKPTQATCCW
ncbi:MAG: hypothetical protein LBR84_09990 [Tannerella sp.]|nr:hypothetical protein [Tannerella sp.]